jgi:hypothetical protein
MDVLEDGHAHALAGDEAVLERGVEWVGATESDAFRKKSLGQHLLKAGLRRPADLICGQTQITVGDQQDFVFFNGSGSYYFRDCIGCHDLFLIDAALPRSATD